jgi:hypothetical protein
MHREVVRAAGAVQRQLRHGAALPPRKARRGRQHAAALHAGVAPQRHAQGKRARGVVGRGNGGPRSAAVGRCAVVRYRPRGRGEGGHVRGARGVCGALVIAKRGGAARGGGVQRGGRGAGLHKRVVGGGGGAKGGPPSNELIRRFGGKGHAELPRRKRLRRSSEEAQEKEGAFVAGGHCGCGNLYLLLPGNLLLCPRRSTVTS